MQKKHNIIKILFIVIIISLIITFVYFMLVKKEENILYSWSMDEVTNYNNLITLGKKFKIKTIYQEFSNSYLTKNDNTFLKQMEKNKIDVYYLTGDPSYDYNDIKEKIDLLYNYNLNNKYKIKGIVFDIEPYLNKNFSNYIDFADNIELGYKYAKEKNIYYVIVIPYWLDKKDIKSLEKIIYNCDEISIMNYHIKNTINNIKEEMYYVKKYNKKINTIYEVNANNDNSFKTYNEINNDFIKMKFKYWNIKKAYHHYSSMNS